MCSHMVPKYLSALLIAAFLMVGAHMADAGSKKPIYKKNYNYVKIIDADDDFEELQPFDHPKEISEAKIYNMLASLHFDKGSLMFDDKEELRLFDLRGLKLLSPYLAQALSEVEADQVVAFQYIKKAPFAKVVRNDRLIAGKCFVRDGELFIRFGKLYAKIVGDYSRAGQQRVVREAQDRRVLLRSMPGQRSLGEKFIALQVEHDFKADLDRMAREEIERKRQKEAAESFSGVPVPATPPPGEGVPTPSTASSKEKAPAKDDTEIKVKLKTLKELRDDDLISEKEYEKKKAELLGEI